jgi:UDP-N-acetylmuramyl pentapeptide phosphotransferase/UDP-N-acetylglucosamine-1-phosphate transferase
VSQPALVGVASFLLTAVATPICIVVARRTGIMDVGGPLKNQTDPVPYLGGVAVFVGLTVGFSADRPIELLPMAGALTVGVADDRFDLSPHVRLVAQVALGVVIAGTTPVHLPGWLGWPLIVAVTVLLINGFNLLDGLDMLAAGVGALAAVGFAVLTHGPDRLAAVSLAGALLAFLLYNRPPARIYLGDGGSYLVGAGAALLVARTWGPGMATSTGVVALALVAIPVAEVSCALVRRRRSGLSIAAGDRGHPYDRLVDRGWTRPAASAAYIGCELAVVAAVTLMPHTSFGGALVLVAAVGAMVLAAAAVCGGMTPSRTTRP